jgi:hypothetical protein
VIMFDVDWNPASDSQAQGMFVPVGERMFSLFSTYVVCINEDRAYRIGQEKDVKVFRLVSRGTIEELKYLRQVYKTQLKSETIIDVNNMDRQKASRLFRGVAGDEHRKGELFGLENLLKFKDGTFMNYASKVAESTRYGIGVHDTMDLLESVKDMSEEDLDNIGGVENIFEGTLKCLRKRPDFEDDDGDTDLGGMSQVVMDVCEQLDARESADKRKEFLNMVSPKTRPTIVETNLPEVNQDSDNETQSPLYDALNLEPQGNDAVEVSKGFVSSTHTEPPASATSRASFIRNTKIIGKTSDQILRGEAGSTTFRRSDLHIPGKDTKEQEESS